MCRGRNLLDHFICELPNHLQEHGVACLMQVSMPGAHRTEIQPGQNPTRTKPNPDKIQHQTNNYAARVISPRAAPPTSGNSLTSQYQANRYT